MDDYTVYPTVAQRWRDDVLHSQRFRWSIHPEGRDKMCKNEGIDAKPPQADDDFDDDDDDLTQSKKRANEPSVIWSFFGEIATVLTSNTAHVLYICVGIAAVVMFLFYYRYFKYVVLRRTQSGYAIVQ
jgi:hypothetical protein